MIRIATRSLLYLGGLFLATGCSSLPTSGPSPSAPPPLSPGVRLEVTATDFDIGWQDSYLYLRVFVDGRAESRVLTRDRRTATEVKDVAGTLSHDMNARIEHLLDRRDLTTGDRSGLGVVDAGTVWTVAWRSQGVVRRVSVVVSVDLGVGPSRPYPESILDLRCTIAAARSEITGLPFDLGGCTGVSPSGASYPGDHGPAQLLLKAAGAWHARALQESPALARRGLLSNA